MMSSSLGIEYCGSHVPRLPLYSTHATGKYLYAEGSRTSPLPRMPYPLGIAEIRNLEVVPRVEHKHPTPRRLKGRELVPGLPLSPIPACRELTSLPLR